MFAHLLYFGRCAPEQFDVPRSYQIPVLTERLWGIVLVGEQYECVARCAAVGFFNEQDAVFAVHDGTCLFAVVEESYLYNNQ